MSFCEKYKREYLPLCSIPRKMSRDGNAGANASIYIPFIGRYFFSGEQPAYANSTIAQDKSRFIGGSSKPAQSGCGCG